MQHTLDLPILLLVFNRPELTLRLVQRLREIQAERIFVVADGPRLDKPADGQLCKKVREIIQSIDWDCNVTTWFREENFGPGKGPATGISWFFEQVEEGIILEDDCLPNAAFFEFSQRMLEKYRSQNEVMHISGNYFLGKKFTFQESHYFSRLPNAWGWATWRRAWAKFDFNLTDLPDFDRKEIISIVFSNFSVRNYWMGRFRMTKNHPERVSWWDYQWFFAIWYNNGLAVIPTRNLVSNIGFGPDASHTKDPSSYFNEIPTEDNLTTQDPWIISANTKADRYLVYHLNLYNIPIKPNWKFHVIDLVNKFKSLFES